MGDAAGSDPVIRQRMCEFKSHPEYYAMLKCLNDEMLKY